MSATTVFPSRIGPLIIVAAMAAIGIPLAIGFLDWNGNQAASIGAFAVAAFSVLVFGVAVIPCIYTLAADHLLVRSGLIRQRIPYRAIDDIAPSRNPLSAPALSLDRVRIAAGNDSTLVSPKDKAGFIKELSRRVDEARNRRSA